MNPLICIRGSASPGHSYQMTPLHVTNTGGSPVTVSYAADPSDALGWLKASSVKIPAGGHANIPLTLVVPSNAPSGEDYVILTAGGTHFDVRFSVSAPAPRQCLAAGYKTVPASRSTALLWLVLLLAIVVAVFWIRRRMAVRR